MGIAIDLAHHIRRTLESSIKKAQDEGRSDYVDCFQHPLDECQRLINELENDMRDMLHEETFESGVQCAKQFYTQKVYAQFDYEIKPELAAKIFLPNVEETMIEMQMPLPKGRQEWLRGFKQEQERILSLTL